MESTWYLGGEEVIQHVDHLHNLVVSVTTLLFEGGVQQGPLNYQFWGNQTMQMYGNFQGFHLQ